jgi:2-phosphosulfolactate phosphatase
VELAWGPPPLDGTVSGAELLEGFADDVRLAGEPDASHVVPVLVDGAFTAASTGARTAAPDPPTRPGAGAPRR